MASSPRPAPSQAQQEEGEQQGAASSYIQHEQQHVLLASLYEASPTPSEDVQLAGSPVRAALATRFYNTSSSLEVAARLAAAAAAGRASSGGGGGLGAAAQPQQPASHASSIYRRDAGLRQLLAGDHHHLAGAVDVAVELERYVPAGGGKDSFWPCTFNLSKVIMGAGMMAIPRAFMLLGLLPGGAIMVLIGCLTFFTLAALISTSAALGGSSSGSSSSSSSACSYGGLVRATLGRRAERVLQLAVLVNCWVMNVVFIVVLGDILVGSAPDYGGLLPDWSGASPASCVWLRRDVVLGTVSAVVLLPLAAMRSMDSLAVVNIIGVACNGVFAGLMLTLAASAAANGVLQPPPLWPDWSELGSTPLVAAVSIATVVPVLLNCDVCHQSLHPLMPLLQPYSVARMQRLVALALAICNSLYLAVTVCSGLVFGPALQPDVLSNVTAAAMAPLIGPAAAGVMAACVRLGYLLSIIGSYVLLCYPLRQCLGDLLLPGGQATVHRHWVPLTALLVASCAAIGAYLPSIWGALALVGATASTMQAFIIPGLIVLAVERRSVKTEADSEDGSLAAPLLAAQRGNGAEAAAPGARTQHAGQRWLRQVAAVACLLIGVALFANSVVGACWDFWHPRAEGGPDLMGLYRQLLAPL